MGQVKVQDHPGETLKDRRGKGQRCWMRLKKVTVNFLLLVGIFAGFLLQPIRLEAKAVCQCPEYEDGIPIEIRLLCEEIGAEFEICPELLESMAYQESRFIPTVRNKNCYGLMQINVKVHKERIEKYGWAADDMFDPEKNLTVAADLLRELYDTYGDDNPIVLSLYSGNWKAVQKYKEYGFLTTYVDDVLTRSAEYERIHGK